MYKILFFSLIGTTFAMPKTTGKLGNPDEWGDHFEGDIMLPLPGLTKNGLIDEVYRWPDGVVAYEFSPDFEESKKPTVRSVFQDYFDLTDGCIEFVERTGETDYVFFTDVEDDGCYSYVGRQGGRQTINYPQWCIDQYGSVQHEQYHALGFYHEQSRTDRDDYVTIEWTTIELGYENNFVKYDADTITAFGYDYDYLSVMHYSQYGFSRNGDPTIVTTDPAYQDQIGQREGLSDTDLGKLMAMYNCDAKQSIKGRINNKRQ